MKVLFITYTRIGDTVLSTGLLSAIIEQNPDAEITIACGPASAELFAATPNIDAVVALNKRQWSLHWWDLWRHCVGTRWDMVVDLRDSVVSRLVRAGRRYILGGGRDDFHRVERIAGTLDLSPAPAPRIWINSDIEDRARALAPSPGPLLAIGPTANWPGKQWSAVRFAELIQRLIAPGNILSNAMVAVFGGPGERVEAEPVLRMIPSDIRIDLVGKVDLLTAYAFLRRSSLYIGNDSGLMHIAAAAGVPTLGLFGPSKEQHYAPWGDHTAVVRTEKMYEELVGGPGYDHRTTGSLMDSLSVDRVEEAAIGLWRRTTDCAA